MWSSGTRRPRRAARCAAFPSALTGVSELLEVRQLLTTDMVLQWNEVLLDAIRADRTAPPAAARDMAIVHTAIFDAVNSIDRQYAPYLTMVDAHPRASREAAVAAAAHETLTALFPAQKPVFDAQYTVSLAQIPDGRGETDGVSAGKEVARRILADRANDGSAATVTYTAGAAPGDWQPTPPAFDSPLLPQWPDVRPWAMTDGDQFRPEAPPELTSRRYARDFDQVKQLGAVDSAARTSDQTATARFWANGPGTSTPPGHWNVVAQIVAQDRRNSLEENARLFALLNITLADAAIVSWDAKYEYDLWRPVTAIRAAETDGNPRTERDPAWTPFLTTPPFPTYTSGHSTFSGAAAAVLQAFFGTNHIRFVLPSETAGVADRRFRSFSQAADESGMSRIYAGIHFNFDNVAGLQSGNQLGRHVAAHFLRRVPGAATSKLINGELMVYGTSRSDSIQVTQRAGELFVTANGRSLGQFVLSHVTHVVVDGGAGNDIVQLIGVTVDSDLYGGSGADVLIGGHGADRIFGEDGPDILWGRTGADLLDGGAGRNVVIGNNTSNIPLILRGLDHLFGGHGLDRLLWSRHV